MIVENEKVVSFDYTLTDSDGNVLDSSNEGKPLSYLHGAGNIIPGLESALTGKTAGDELQAVIAPEDAYGVRDESLVGAVPRENLSGIQNLQVGMHLEAQTPQGPRVVRITDVSDDTVTIDANHPLAGTTLHFDVTIKDVRESTSEEREHGHVHGPGGHEH